MKTLIGLSENIASKDIVYFFLNTKQNKPNDNRRSLEFENIRQHIVIIQRDCDGTNNVNEFNYERCMHVFI